MSDPSNFQSSYDWSQNYLRDPKPGSPSFLSILFVVVLLILAGWWWWISYGSSVLKQKESRGSAPKAGFDDLRAGLKNGATQMMVKSNGMVVAV